MNRPERLESLTKTVGVDLLASRAVKDRAAGFNCQTLEPTAVRGKSEKVELFSPKPPTS